jgi:polyisoprenoid-binding protein YceI
MKNAIYSIPILLLMQLLFASVSFAETNNCSYELENGTVRIAWTAFKTSQKVAVNGAFKTIDIQGKNKANSLSDLVQGLKISVDPLSIETGNPARDKTLAEFFFKKLSKSISGNIKNFSEKDQSFILVLNLNGHSRNVPFHYVFAEDKVFKANGSIDILKFGAAKALKSLNGQCYDLHKGPDGVSKTWSDVDLTFSGAINRHCS